VHTVNSSITILISLSDHLINLIIRQLLTDGCHNMTELSSRDEAVVVTVENLFPSAPGCRPASLRQLTLNASLISSSESVSFIFLAIMVRNSVKPSAQVSKAYCRERFVPGKSIVPLLSASTSLIMSCNSDSEGFWPRDRITVPSSLVVICPIEPLYQHNVRDMLIFPLSAPHDIARVAKRHGRGNWAQRSKSTRAIP
jgi:hypothetical protein